MPDIDQKCKVIYNPDISLAMYRELAAHLAQIDRVSAELIWQDSPTFDYAASQISGMWLHYPRALSQSLYHLVQEILSHYGNWTAEPKLFDPALSELLVSKFQESNF
ncbi:hypothetical protein V2H45_12105 [Tumidithrix elongata RA019]|uniref:Uncharacterized protein n=1 Tax=Tumidithrix elongata BACA0141 TaxID=2716417 RepID=A0AAW9PWV1_9CYAN|nr:hypothetical protein [Tumidithrix elongata RA019]